jgi:hypothetical protein
MIDDFNNCTKENSEVVKDMLLDASAGIIVLSDDN